VDNELSQVGGCCVLTKILMLAAVKKFRTKHWRSLMNNNEGGVSDNEVMIFCRAMFLANAALYAFLDR